LVCSHCSPDKIPCSGYSEPQRACRGCAAAAVTGGSLICKSSRSSTRIADPAEANKQEHDRVRKLWREQIYGHPTDAEKQPGPSHWVTKLPPAAQAAWLEGSGRVYITVHRAEGLIPADVTAGVAALAGKATSSDPYCKLLFDSQGCLSGCFAGLMTRIAKSDPYCKLIYDSQVMKTKKVNKTLNPIFEESFEILVRNPNAPSGLPKRGDQHLEIALYDYDMATQDDHLGSVFLDVFSFKPGKKYSGWFRIRGPTDGENSVDVMVQTEQQIMDLMNALEKDEVDGTFVATEDVMIGKKKIPKDSVLREVFVGKPVEMKDFHKLGLQVAREPVKLSFWPQDPAGGIKLTIRTEFDVNRLRWATITGVGETEPYVPPFNLDDLYSLGMELADILWFQFGAKVLTKLLSILTWEQPRASAKALAACLALAYVMRWSPSILMAVAAFKHLETKWRNQRKKDKKKKAQAARRGWQAMRQEVLGEESPAAKSSFSFLGVAQRVWEANEDRIERSQGAGEKDGHSGADQQEAASSGDHEPQHLPSVLTYITTFTPGISAYKEQARPYQALLAFAVGKFRLLRDIFTWESDLAQYFNYFLWGQAVILLPILVNYKWFLKQHIIFTFILLTPGFTCLLGCLWWYLSDNFSGTIRWHWEQEQDGREVVMPLEWANPVARAKLEKQRHQ